MGRPHESEFSRLVVKLDGLMRQFARIQNARIQNARMIASFPTLTSVSTRPRLRPWASAVYHRKSDAYIVGVGVLYFAVAQTVPVRVVFVATILVSFVLPRRVSDYLARRVLP